MDTQVKINCSKRILALNLHLQMPQAMYERSSLKVKVKSRPTLCLRETFYSLSIFIFHLGQ